MSLFVLALTITAALGIREKGGSEERLHWRVAGCEINEKSVWTAEVPNYSATWIVEGAKARLQALGLLALAGDFDRHGPDAGTLRLTDVDLVDDDEVDIAARSILQGLRQWRVGTVLAVTFSPEGGGALRTGEVRLAFQAFSPSEFRKFDLDKVEDAWGIAGSLALAIRDCKVEGRSLWAEGTPEYWTFWDSEGAGVTVQAPDLFTLAGDFVLAGDSEKHTGTVSITSISFAGDGAAGGGSAILEGLRLWHVGTKLAATFDAEGDGSLEGNGVRLEFRDLKEDLGDQSDLPYSEEDSEVESTEEVSDEEDEGEEGTDDDHGEDHAGEEDRRKELSWEDAISEEDYEGGGNYEGEDEKSEDDED